MEGTKNNSGKWWVVAIIIILVAVGISSLKKPTQTESIKTESIKIGGIFILSGEGASWGEAAKNGMELAIKEINNNGGIDGKNLEGIYEDDKSTPQGGIAAFNKLTNSDKVNYVIGPNWSTVGIPLINLIKEKGIVTISPSLGLAEFNESSPYIFNTWPHDYILSQNLAQYMYDKGYRNVALFGANEVWVKDQTKAFKEKFESLGGKIGFIYEPLPTVTDVRTEVLKVKNNPKIDAIAMTIDGYALTDITAKQIKQLGINLPMYSITIDNQIIKNCEGACDGMIFLTFLTPTSDFEKKYKSTYNREVEIGSDSAYDAIMLLAKAFKDTKSIDPTKVQEYLHTINIYNGASGKLISDGKGAFTKPYVIKQVQNGESVTIK